MRDHSNRSRTRSISLVAASLPAVILLTSLTAAAQTKGSDAKLPCVGCAVDGKTPRLPDEHPNLNGFWSTPPRTDNAGRQVDRSDDGSILFEFSINFDETIPDQLCIDDSCQVKNQPPYNSVYMPKVKALADTMYLGTSSQ